MILRAYGHLPPEAVVVYYSVMAVALLVGCVFIVKNFFIKRDSEQQLNRTLRLIGKNPANAAGYARKLSCPIGFHKPVADDQLKALVQSLKANPQLGNYVVHGVFSIGGQEWLFITMCHDDTLFQRNFLLRANAEKQRIEICSHLYETHDEGYMLKSFPRELFARMNEPHRSTYGQ